MRKVYLVASFVFLFNLSFAQSWQDTIIQIEKVVSQYYQLQSPGVQLSISRNGEIIFSKAWGMADLEHGVPLTTNSILEAGSVSKQFTAAAILLLEQQGKLSVNDDVRKYVPELPDYGHTIRLRHLLHHTSGLRDWGSVADLTGWGRTTKFYTNNDALEIIARQKRLNNKPGDEYIYSNSNYNLQAIIVQRVSGLSLADFTRKYIFEPAQMLHTSWRDNPNRIVPNRAIAYSSTGNDFQINMPNEYVYGNGGLLTTTEDLLKWNSFYLNGKLAGASFLEKQLQTEPFNNGAAAEYAAGLVVQKMGGWNTISHGGATAGYRAHIIFYPELKLSIAILSNTPQNFTTVTDAIRKLFVTDRSEQQNVQVASYKPSEASLKNYKGWYKNERDGTGFKLTVKKDSLFIYETPLQAVAENKFRVGSQEFLMNRNKGLYFIIPGRDTISYTRTETASLTTNRLREYEGTFFSEETISSVIISIVKDSLSMRLKPDEVYSLLPLYKDGFASPEGDFNLYFIRDRNGKVQKLKISVDRARNVEFEKMK
jgi:CubicO group peptidase (beta-lactamase class C family)